MDLLSANFDLLLKAGAIDEVLDALEKGAGHKYIRRIPTGNAKRKYRYIYSAAHAVAEGADPTVGEKVRVKDSGKEGHYEVTALHDDGHVTIKHDESGATMRVHAGQLRDMLASEHAPAIAEKHEAALKIHAQALKTGTPKQQKRAADHLKRLGLEGEAKKATALAKKREKARDAMRERRKTLKIAARPAKNLDELDIKHRHVDMLPRSRKSVLDAIKEASGIDDHDLAQADVAYASWKGRGSKGPKPMRGTTGGKVGGELDSFEGDLKRGEHFSSLLEAFEHATRGAKTWRDIAPVMAQLRDVPGFENAHLPEDALLRHGLQEQERREWDESGAPAVADDDGFAAFDAATRVEPEGEGEGDGGGASPDTTFDFGANEQPDEPDEWGTDMWRSGAKLVIDLRKAQRRALVTDMRKADGTVSMKAPKAPSAPAAPKPPSAAAEPTVRIHAPVAHGPSRPPPSSSAPATSVGPKPAAPKPAAAPSSPEKTAAARPAAAAPAAPAARPENTVSRVFASSPPGGAPSPAKGAKPSSDGSEFNHLSGPVSGETPEESVPKADGILQHGIVGHTSTGKQVSLGMNMDTLSPAESHEASLLHREAQEHLLNAARSTGNNDYKKAARSHLDEEFQHASRSVAATGAAKAKEAPATGPGSKAAPAPDTRGDDVFRSSSDAAKSLAGWERLAAWHPSPMWAGEDIGSSFGMLLRKALGGERQGHKYIKRTPRAGGGYDYEYADTPHTKETLKGAPTGSTLEVEHNGEKATYTKTGRDDWKGAGGGAIASGWFVGKPSTLTHGTPHPEPAPAPATPSMVTPTAKPFELTAKVVQQGLFGDSAYERKTTPKPKKPDPEAHRQTSMFDAPPKPSPMAEATKEAEKQPAAPERERSPEENRAAKINAEREKHTAVMLERAKELLDFKGAQLDPRSDEYRQIEEHLASAQDDYDAARETAAEGQDRINARIKGEGKSLQREHEFGSHVGGSRKDQAEIRKLVDSGQLDKVTNAEAARYLNKSSHMPTVTAEHYKSMGATPGAAHASIVLSSLVAAKPGDSAEERAAYLNGVRMVAGGLQKIRTAADARAFQEEMRAHASNAGDHTELLSPAESAAVRITGGYSREKMAARDAVVAKVAARVGQKMNHIGIGENRDGSTYVRWTDDAEKESIHDMYRALGQRFIAGLNLRVPQKGKWSRKATRWGSDTTFGAALQHADTLDSHVGGPAAGWAMLEGAGAAKAAESEAKKQKRAEAAEETAEDRMVMWRRSVSEVPDLTGTKVNVPEIDHKSDADLFGGQERVGKSFGFTAVQPGENLLGSKDEKTGKFTPSKKGREDYAYHLRHGEMAFHDLADVLGLSPTQVSLNGKLALAIAARGKGKAGAHYESDHKVINLTRFRGAGTVAHEWGHFLDNVMAEAHGATETSKFGSYASHGHGHANMAPELASAFRDVMKAIKERPAHEVASARSRAEARKKEIMTETGRLSSEIASHDRQRRVVGHDSEAGKQHGDDAARKRDMHEKLREEYKRIRDTPHSMSTYMKHANAFDGTKPGNYWANNHELFARAFEAFVQDKLEVPTSTAKAARRNTYLVDGTRALTKTGRKVDGEEAQVYPQGAERHQINAAFEKLIGVLHNTGAFKKALKALSSTRLTARRPGRYVDLVITR